MIYKILLDDEIIIDVADGLPKAYYAKGHQYSEDGNSWHPMGREMRLIHKHLDSLADQDLVHIRESNINDDRPNLSELLDTELMTFWDACHFQQFHGVVVNRREEIMIAVDGSGYRFKCQKCREDLKMLGDQKQLSMIICPECQRYIQNRSALIPKEDTIGFYRISTNKYKTDNGKIFYIGIWHRPIGSNPPFLGSSKIYNLDSYRQ